MKEIVTMDESGCLVLPGPIRTALHLENSTSFEAQIVSGKLELTPLQRTNDPQSPSSDILVLSTGKENFNAAEALRKTREERW